MRQVEVAAAQYFPGPPQAPEFRLETWILYLKGHGNEADFLGFLQKLVPQESLALPFKPFRFLLQIRGDIHIRKTTPRYHRYGESPTPRITDMESRLLNF
jgi:hypothetical protein